MEFFAGVIIEVDVINENFLMFGRTANDSLLAVPRQKKGKNCV